MWNNRVRFEPDEIIGLLVLVEQETEYSLSTHQRLSWVAFPYSLIPHDLLVYESFRLMHTLVSEASTTPWPNAIEEALLFGLCKAVLVEGREGLRVTETRETVNAFRRRGGLPSVRSLEHVSEDDWEIDVLDQLLFSDRDWQMATAEMIRHPELCDDLGIREDYFDVRLRNPSALELQNAQRVFRELLARAAARESACGLADIPPLHLR